MDGVSTVFPFSLYLNLFNPILFTCLASHVSDLTCLVSLTILCFHNILTVLTHLAFQVNFKTSFPSCIKNFSDSQVPVAHTCNPSYSESRDQEDCGSKPAVQIVHGTLSWKHPTQNKAGSADQDVGPECKTQYALYLRGTVCIRWTLTHPWKFNRGYP
jgi:hypothetical protein